MSFESRCLSSNRTRSRLDLLFPAAGNHIQRLLSLYSDKTTLLRQMEDIRRRHQHTQQELYEMRSAGEDAAEDGVDVGGEGAAGEDAAAEKEASV